MGPEYQGSRLFLSYRLWQLKARSLADAKSALIDGNGMPYVFLVQGESDFAIQRRGV